MKNYNYTICSNFIHDLRIVALSPLIKNKYLYIVMDYKALDIET